jgi:hypothetical protein
LGAGRIKWSVTHMSSALKSGPVLGLAKSLCRTAKDRLAMNTVVDCVVDFLATGVAVIKSLPVSNVAGK